jgi:hypothetical protein
MMATMVMGDEGRILPGVSFPSKAAGWLIDAGLVSATTDFTRRQFGVERQ